LSFSQDNIEKCKDVLPECTPNVFFIAYSWSLLKCRAGIPRGVVQGSIVYFVHEAIPTLDQVRHVGFWRACGPNTFGPDNIAEMRWIMPKEVELADQVGPRTKFIIEGVSIGRGNRERLLGVAEV
jgi:hypothetical protein